jgi:beta-lactam-binding protein with PASTA domain
VAVVPQLEGLTLANAAELLVELGIEFDYANDLEKDSELEVKEQAPKPGSMISRDEKVVIIA